MFDELPGRREGFDRTPWFPATVRPIHPGVYEREFPHRVLYSEWTGHQWLIAASTPNKATRQREVSQQQAEDGGVRWRGRYADGVPAVSQPAQHQRNEGAK